MLEELLKKYNKSRYQNGEKYLGYDDSRKEFVVYGRKMTTERFSKFERALERVNE